MAEIYQISTRIRHIPEDTILQQQNLERPPHRSAHTHRNIQNTQPQEPKHQQCSTRTTCTESIRAIYKSTRN